MNTFDTTFNFQNYLSRSPVPINMYQEANIPNTMGGMNRQNTSGDKGGQMFYSMENRYVSTENISNSEVNNKVPQLTEEEKIKEQSIRGDYAAKYAKLKENFPHIEIVGPKEEWSVAEIIARFNGYAKTIQTEASVEHNQMYLLLLWTVIQFAGTRWCGLPLDGYIEFQGTMIKKYQDLLSKLTEDKTIAVVSEGWSIPMQIIWLSITTCILYMLCKWALSTLGPKIGNNVSQKLKDIFETYNNPEKAGKSNDKLKEALEATKDNPKPSMAKPGKPSMGGMLGKIMGMFGGGDEGGDLFSGGMEGILNNVMGSFLGGDEEEEAPKSKKPKGYAARRRRMEKGEDNASD